MQLISLQKDVVPFRVNYGMRLFEDDGHVYLYGTFTSGSRGYTWPVVARSTTLDLLDTWEYYIVNSETGGQWQRSVPTMEEIEQSAIAGSDRTESPNIFRYEDAYYMLALNAPSGQLAIWQGTSPWGPFSKKKSLYTMPSEEKYVKHLFFHPQLSRMGEIVCSYTMSPVETSIWTKKSDGSFLETVISGNDRCYNAWGSANLNLPHFRRIFNWQTLYGIDSREPLADAGLQSYTDMLNDIAAPSLSGDDWGEASWQLMTPDGKLIAHGKGRPDDYLRGFVNPVAGTYILLTDTPSGRTAKKFFVN
jgi:hypothetical protein